METPLDAAGIRAPRAAAVRRPRGRRRRRRALTYGAFFDRCDRWSASCSSWASAQGDRVAYIAPNTHAQLESFYAVPQIGAVLVPINYRLTADDFAYIINHSGATVVCAHARLPRRGRRHPRRSCRTSSTSSRSKARARRLARLRGAARRRRRPSSTRPEIAETRPADASTTPAARRRGPRA